MKTYTKTLFVILLITCFGCHSGSKEHHHSSDHGHEHSDHDGHDHDDHNHADHDGHEHSEESQHSSQEGTEEHSDEIIFSKEQAELVGLATETVVMDTFRQVIKTSGRIEPIQGNEAFIVATSNGIISFTNPPITEGMPVTIGQSIATISAKSLPEGDPTVKAKIAYEMVQKELQRAEELIKDQIISAKEYEQIKLRYETLKTSYEAQASHVTSQGVSISAPMSGYIKSSEVRQGEYVSVGQSIASVLQNDRLQLRAEVPENQYKMLTHIRGAHFKPGYEDVVYPLSELNGQLLSFGKASGEASFYIPVLFQFDNTADLIPGTFAEVFLLSDLQDSIISVPVSSLTEEQGLHFVYLQLDEEGYKKQEVVLGQNNGKRVQILSGLKVNDRVVTKGVYQVKLAATSSVIPEGHSH